MRTTILSGDCHSAQLTTAELNQIIDLDRYPLHQLDSTKGQALVTQCQRDLDAHAAPTLNNFIRPDAVERLTKEAEALTPSSYRFIGKPRQTYPDADPTSEQDPKAESVRVMKHANSNNQVLNYQIPNNSDLGVMFLWPQLCEFVRWVRRVETLYTSQCPHLSLTMKVAFEGDNDGWHYDPNDGWHYDPNDGVVTLLLQSPDEGGGFEYAPNIRSKTDENYEGVKRLFDDPDKVGIRVPQNPGTLIFFNGWHSMHRVRPVGRTLKPRIVGIFSFGQRPDQIFGENYIRMIQALPQGAP